MDGLENYRTFREAVETLGIESFVAKAVNEARARRTPPPDGPTSESDARLSLLEPTRSVQPEPDDAVIRADW